MLLGNTKFEYCERWKYSNLFGLSSKCYMLQPLEKKRNNVNNTSNNRSQKINSFINEAKREQINSTALRGRDKERLFPIVQLGMTTLEHVIHSI
jgi:hypothetical protein